MPRSKLRNRAVNAFRSAVRRLSIACRCNSQRCAPPIRTRRRQPFDFRCQRGPGRCDRVDLVRLAATGPSRPLRRADVARPHPRQRRSVRAADWSHRNSCPRSRREHGPQLAAGSKPAPDYGWRSRRKRRRVERRRGAGLLHDVAVSSCIRVNADDVVILISHGAHSDCPLPLDEQCSPVWRGFEAELF